MSDDRDWRQYTRRGALALMGLGAGLAATETLGFTNVTRDRGLDINTSNDLNALLKIAAQTDNGEKPLNSSSAQPFHPSLSVKFTNNAAEQVTLSSISSTDSIENDFSSDQDLASGETVTVDFENTARSLADTDIIIEADISSGIRIHRSDISFRAADGLSTNSDPQDPSKRKNTDITATVTDTNGNGLPELEVEFTVDDGGGELSSETATTDDSGKATVTYKPVSSDNDSTITISADLVINDLSESIDIGFGSS